MPLSSIKTPQFRILGGWRFRTASDLVDSTHHRRASGKHRSVCFQTTDVLTGELLIRIVIFCHVKSAWFLWVTSQFVWKKHICWWQSQAAVSKSRSWTSSTMTMLHCLHPGKPIGRRFHPLLWLENADGSKRRWGCNPQQLEFNQEKCRLHKHTLGISAVKKWCITWRNDEFDTRKVNSIKTNGDLHPWINQ